jgi:hypothetical protein
MVAFCCSLFLSNSKAPGQAAATEQLCNGVGAFFHLTAKVKSGMCHSAKERY